MIHLLPIAAADEAGAPYADAVARLASIRHARRRVDPWGGGPADDIAESELGAFWERGNDAGRRCFATRSERTIGAAAAGIETMVAVKECGREAHPDAIDELAEAIRAGLDDLADLLRR